MTTGPVNLPPDPSRVIEGLRDTGYTFNTAIADVIDNSITHGNASKISVGIDMDLDGKILVTIADNGIGMELEKLINAMKYGSQALDDPLSLGKFGLGLKTASTAYCRRLSVLTRPKGGNEYLKAVWDLDHIAEVNAWKLLMEDPSAADLQYLNGVSEDSGTVVIWEKVDRAIKEYQSPTGSAARRALTKLKERLEFHISLVYQKYLDPNVSEWSTLSIDLNGNAIHAWDPFCTAEEDTELLAEDKQPVYDENDNSVGEFTIKAYALPNKFSFSSVEARQNARLGNSMQGFYIYRHGRLIHNGSWLGLFTQEPHGSLHRVEFCFDHNLDEAFQLDIKKSRILLNEGIASWLKNEFLPAPRRAADKKYRKGKRSEITASTAGIHDSSNSLIASRESEVSGSKVEVVDMKRGEAMVTNRYGESKIKLTISEAENPSELFVKPVESIDDGLLWEPGIIDSNKAVLINTGHIYYERVYLPNKNDGVIVQGVDSLLWALCEAEMSTINDKTQRYFRELRFEVSRVLRNLIEELPEGEIED
ncbi:MAG: ATP-binding protein [Bacteroidetes bacterium]|nr:ATP-binding protein [Bacteroidota bacterium]